MTYKATDAYLCEIHLTVVTQPGQDPGDLYDRVMRAIEDVAGQSGGTSFGEYKNGQMTSSSLFKMEV